MAVSTDSKSRAFYFYSPRNQTTSCQYKLSKKTSAAHYRGTSGLAVIESKLNTCTRVLSQNKIYVLVRVRPRDLNHMHLNLYLYFILW